MLKHIILNNRILFYNSQFNVMLMPVNPSELFRFKLNYRILDINFNSFDDI